jgi:Lrp/AsnC family transcriptional regulator for asnA, asnC and gidA
MSTDNTDRQILNALMEDSRLSYRKIGHQIGVSAATVMNRLKRLEKEGILKKYSCVLDYEKLDYDVQVIIDVRISKGKLFEVENKIAVHPNVFAVYDNTGSFDTTIIAKFKSRKQMDIFLKSLQAYDFVERTETKLILNTIKEDAIRV